VVQLPSHFFLFLRVPLFGAVVVPFLFQIAILSPVQAGLQSAVESVLNYHPSVRGHRHFERVDRSWQ